MGDEPFPLCIDVIYFMERNKGKGEGGRECTLWMCNCYPYLRVRHNGCKSSNRPLHRVDLTVPVKGLLTLSVAD